RDVSWSWWRMERENERRTEMAPSACEAGDGGLLEQRGVDLLEAQASAQRRAGRADVGDHDGRVGVGVDAAEHLRVRGDVEQLLLGGAAFGPLDMQHLVAVVFAPVDFLEREAVGGGGGEGVRALE